jgi:uncharacterized protein YbcI
LVEVLPLKSNTPPRTKGEIESEISRAVIQFEKELTGRGPLETRAYLVGDMVVVRMRGALTVAEQQLAARDDPRARYLIKEVRRELLLSGRDRIERQVGEIVRAGVRCLHTDISTRTGERVLVFQLDRRLGMEAPTESIAPLAGSAN